MRGWTQEAALGDPLPTHSGKDGDQFGDDLSVAGNEVVVGASGQDADQGTAYVYARSPASSGRWGLDGRLDAVDGAADDEFGGSVAIDGGTVFVGAANKNTNGQYAGALYVFASS